jgi:hypothetical protein
MAQETWGSALQNAAAGPQPVAEGTYDVRVKSAKYQRASSGKDMIVVVLEIMSGMLAGKTIWNNFVMQPDRETSMGYFFRDMEGFGLAKEWFAQALGNHPIDEQTCGYVATQLVGRMATVDVKFQANDRSRNDCKNFRPIQGPGGAVSVQPPAMAAPPTFAQAPAGMPGVPQIPGGFPQAPQFAGPTFAEPVATQPQFQPPQQAPFQPQQPQQFQPPMPTPAPGAPPAFQQPQFQPPGFAPAGPPPFDPAQQAPQQPTAAQDPWVTTQPPAEWPPQQQPAAPPAYPQPQGAPVPQPPGVTF